MCVMTPVHVVLCQVYSTKTLPTLYVQQVDNMPEQHVTSWNAVLLSVHDCIVIVSVVTLYDQCLVASVGAMRL